MLDLEQIISLIPPVECIDDDVARRRREAARRFKHPAEGHARPLADGLHHEALSVPSDAEVCGNPGEVLRRRYGAMLAFIRNTFVGSYTPFTCRSLP